MGSMRHPLKPRRRVGSVSYYRHHGGWWIYYRDGGVPVRRRVAGTEEAAAQVAAQVNGQLAISAPTLFSYTPIMIPDLRLRFLDHHEHVRRSSLATVRRYRAVTQHLENFVGTLGKSIKAHQLEADDFVRYLRHVRVAANGHCHSKRRPLRDNGIRYILETCRSMYGYAARKRHLPPYSDNPFAGLGGKRFRVEDAKRIFVFDQDSELRFFQTVNDWALPVHFTLAKTGMRIGEVAHLLIEDLDLEAGWLQVCNQPELGWRIKTGRERMIPLVEELNLVLRRAVAGRTAGPVFCRPGFTPPAFFATADRHRLAQELEGRIAAEEAAAVVALTREQVARIAAGVWRDAGAVHAAVIRNSFSRTNAQLGMPHATCPKSWRHTFATLLQDANVDPLIRQLTLGHAFMCSGLGALGMTTVYTHTRPETQKREIERALRLWDRSLRHARQWAGRIDEC